jgi:hypothetical protein
MPAKTKTKNSKSSKSSKVPSPRADSPKVSDSEQDDVDSDVDSEGEVNSDAGKNRKQVVRVDFNSADYKAVGRAYPNLTKKQYSDMISSLLFDFDKIISYTKSIYSLGDGDKRIGNYPTKKQMVQCYSEYRTNIKRLKFYHAAKTVRKTKRSSGNGFKKIIFATDNMRDLYLELNMGNGLAKLLAHKYTPTGSQKASKTKFYDANKFIALANSVLDAKDHTNVTEIRELLKYHHPKYNSYFSILAESDSEQNKYHFTTTKNGGVNPKDKHLIRILAIHNAYVEAYNAEEPEEQLETKTVQEVIPDIAIQTKDLSYEYEGKMRQFNVSEILNFEIKLQNPYKNNKTFTYSTAVENGNTSNSVLSLIANVNDLHQTGTKGRIFSKLLDKYFGGSDADYAPGLKSSLFFDKKERTYDAEGKSMEVVQRELRQALPVTMGNKIPVKAGDSALSSKNQGKLKRFVYPMQNEMTYFDYCNYLYRDMGKNSSKGEPYTEDGGIMSSIYTQANHFFQIPYEYVRDPEVFKDEELSLKVLAFNAEISTIGHIYTAYRPKAPKTKKVPGDSKVKASAMSPKVDGKVSKPPSLKLVPELQKEEEAEEEDAASVVSSDSDGVQSEPGSDSD